MKQVAGTLRLDLAQFRELEAFAQFGSELDKSTQLQIDRGRRMVEILKQPQYKPLPMHKQVLILFAGTRGYLDALPVERLADYETRLYDYVQQRCPAIYDELQDKKAIDDDLETKIKAALDEFTGAFLA
jgi:F-type H+-transporting ATPase subunit alpha